ncbi:MAG: SRPBCC family protein [Candidatus Kryptonium sp.]
MKVYQLKAKQILPVSLEEAWDFFSSPQNLSKITPKWLDFRIISKTPDKMYSGTIIVYKVKPIFNIPITWVTEITHINEPFYFVDEQRFGPYKMWHHEHIFREIKDVGVEMQDVVTYIVPFGIVGSIINSISLRKRLMKIFEYRREAIKRIFGTTNFEETQEYIKFEEY